MIEGILNRNRRNFEIKQFAETRRLIRSIENRIKKKKKVRNEKEIVRMIAYLGCAWLIERTGRGTEMMKRIRIKERIDARWRQRILNTSLTVFYAGPFGLGLSPSRSVDHLTVTLAPFPTLNYDYTLHSFSLYYQWVWIF